MPAGLSQKAKDLYTDKLHEVPYDRAMAKDGNRGGHADWTHPDFVANWIAPIILGKPAPHEFLKTDEKKGQPPGPALTTPR